MPGPTIGTQDLLRNRSVGVCQFLQLTEENVRFLLLAVFLYVYLCLGAFMFQAVEESAENQIRENYEALFNEFRDNLSLLNEVAQPFGGEYLITNESLNRLLRAYGDASKAGVLTRKRWDWVGSFHFAWTIVSTIGYGVTSPTTTAGQLLIIPYGFFGCASGLLFFNLFLERIITFLSSCMRYYRIQRQKRRSYAYGGGTSLTFPNPLGRRGSHSSAGNGSTTTDESDWKPSVYWVMLCLFFMSAVIISGSAGMFHSMEGWTYVESLYFCFVSYATIGFGDYVSMQQHSYGDFELVYRIAAFTLMVLGCCCIYSLLNVMSIVIKQSLNWLIKKMDDWRCCSCCNCLTRTVRRNFSVKRIQRRNNNGSSKRPKSQIAAALHIRGSTSGDDRTQPYSIDMEERERRYSGENMISIRGELNNKVSLAVMQKRLYETAQMSRCAVVSRDKDFSARSVGPLAIVTEKLEENHC